MKIRRSMLVLLAVVALSGALLGTALAAPRSQESATTDVRPERAEEAFLGLVTTALNDRIKQYLGLPEDVEGLGVMGTIDGSPANEAGLQRADVVLSVDDVTLVTPRELHRFLKTKHPGDDIEIVYFRDGSRAAVTVTLANGADFRPAGPPAWLTKLHKFMAAFPNTVDATLRVLTQDGEVRDYIITPGTVLAVEDHTVGIENRLGEVIRYEVVDGTVIIAGRHRVPLTELSEGTKVVMLEIDEALKAIVLMREVDDAVQIRPDKIDEIQVNPRRQVVERFRRHITELREEFRTARGSEQVTEVVESLRARILQLQARLAGIDATGAA